MDRGQSLLRSRHFWTVTVMLVICGFFHYFTPQIPLLHDSTLFMTRQAVVRIIFLLPVVAAAFAFGKRGGLVTLGLATLIMLPRVISVSEQPVDAFLETLGVVVVGCILVWMIDVQEREKKLRQRAVEELEAVNAVALTLTQPHDLDAMLSKALAKVLEVVNAPRPRGAILLLDPWGQVLNMRACQGVSPGFVKSAKDVPLAECLCGLTAESGEVLVVRDALNHPRHVRCIEKEPHTHVCVPLKSKDRLLGVMDLYVPVDHPVDDVDREMFGAIGRQVGVAVENARLCENLRFYVRQISGAQEDERKRIARELHDDTAQHLIALSRALDSLAASEGNLSPQGRDRIEQLQQSIEDTLQGVRRFSRDLRPSVLDDLGLLAALEGLLARQRENGVAAELRVSGQHRRLSPEAELELFRIVQEALRNVSRHAGASQVWVETAFDDGRVRVTVRDDGRGFTLPASTGDFTVAGKFGLLGIEERAQLLHGHLEVQSASSQGTAVTVDIPT